MAAPNLAARTVAYVNKTGTDDAGYNSVTRPESYLTIAAALAGLANTALYPAATAANPHVIAVGPGTYSTPAFALPPNTFLAGDPDAADAGNPVIISLTGNVTLSAAWSTNATQVGGMANVSFTIGSGTPMIDLTVPTPAAGTPSRTLYLNNIRRAISTFQFVATGSGDAIEERNTVETGTAGLDLCYYAGGTVMINNFLSPASMRIQDSTAVALTGQIYAVFITAGSGSGIVVRTQSGRNVTARLGASDFRTLTIGETGAGVVAVAADAISIPTSLSFTGTATSADLTPTTPGSAVAFPILAPAGTVAAPSYSFSGDSNTGMYQVGADQLGFATAGALALTLDASQNAIFGGYIGTFARTVVQLPAAAAGNRGYRAYVTDANATLTAGIGAVVAGGGANVVPVFSDGGAWRIG